jgi:hypothetical protein
MRNSSSNSLPLPDGKTQFHPETNVLPPLLRDDLAGTPSMLRASPMSPVLAAMYRRMVLGVCSTPSFALSSKAILSSPHSG